MNRVVITRRMMPKEWGIYMLCFMGVCAEEDATDEEILEICNSENPCGTTNGWTRVIREAVSEIEEKLTPVICADDPGRVHFIVAC